MSNAFYISIEGFEAQEWKHGFESGLAGLLPDEGLVVFVPRAIGGAGGGKKNQVGVRNNTRALNLNTSASVLASILLAASIAIPNSPLGTEVECTIEGDKGSISITVSGKSESLAEVIESCLEEIGSPERMNLSPKRAIPKTTII